MFEKEVTGQDEDHFITVDAVGCFEDDEDEEDDDNEEEEEGIEAEEFCKQVLGGRRECGRQGGGWTPSPGRTSPHLPGARRHCAGIFRH